MSVPYYVQTLVGQLSRAREDRRLSQTDIAAVVGCSKQAVSSWETGRSEPPLSALDAYARAVGCRLRVAVSVDTHKRRVGVAPAGEGQPAPGRQLRPRTAARAAEERLYLARSREWLAGKVCARCGTSSGLTVQHLRGRRGRLLLDERHWMALCWDPCHMWAEANPAEAKRLGFAMSKLGEAS